MSDYESYVIDASNNGSGVVARINAAFSDYPAVRIAATVYVDAPIIVPTNKRLYSEGQETIIKNANGPMCILQSWAETHGLFWSGVGAKFDGPGIVCPGNTGQQAIEHTKITGMRGPCIDMSESAAATAASISGPGTLLQRFDPTTPAIVLPQSDPAVSGLRKLLDLRAGGGLLIDLAGSSATTLMNCDSVGCPMTDNCHYAVVAFCRIAGNRPWQIRGSNGRYICNTISSPVQILGSGIYYDASNRDGGVTWRL